MLRVIQEISDGILKNSRHILPENPGSAFVRIDPASVSAEKRKLIAAKPIWVSIDDAAMQRLCTLYHAGNWQEIFAITYFPQIAMGAYLKDLLNLEQISTILLTYSIEVQSSKNKVYLYPPRDELDDVRTINAIIAKMQPGAESQKGMFDVEKFISEYKKLPLAERYFFISSDHFHSDDTKIVDGHVKVLSNNVKPGLLQFSMASVGIVNLFLRCINGGRANKKPIQCRLDMLSKEDIESSVRDVQRFVNLNYPDANIIHWPIYPNGFGIDHDFKHIRREMLCDDVYYDFAFYLVDTMRKISGLRWSSYIWELIDEPIFGSAVKNYDTSTKISVADRLTAELKSIQTTQPALFAGICIDILSNEKKLNVDIGILLLALIPVNAEALIKKHINDDRNILILKLMILIFLKQHPLIKCDFDDVTHQIDATLKPVELRFSKPKASVGNLTLQLTYKDLVINNEAIEKLIESLGVSIIQLPSPPSVANAGFFSTNDSLYSSSDVAEIATILRLIRGTKP